MKNIALAGTLLIIALQSVMAQKAENTAEDQNGSNVNAQIKTLADQGRQSALKGDTSFLEKHTTADYTAILPNGMMLSKGEVIQMRKNGDVKYESIDLLEEKITHVWQHRCVEWNHQGQGDDEGQRHQRDVSHHASVGKAGWRVEVGQYAVNQDATVAGPQAACSSTGSAGAYNRRAHKAFAPHVKNFDV